MEIKGYNSVGHSELQEKLKSKQALLDIHELDLASNIEVKSVGTIRNALNSTEQVVSDEVLTKISSFLKINSAVVWIGGKRNYFLSKQ